MGSYVAITGYGMVNHLGKNVQEAWSRLQLLNALESIEDVRPLDVTEYFEKKERKRLDSFTRYAMVASMEALTHANINSPHETKGMGVYVGAAGNGADQFLLDNHLLLLERGPKRVSPYYSSASMINSPPAEIAIKNGSHGPSGTIIAGEAGSLIAIGHGLRAIQNEGTSLIVAGGTQGDISDLTREGYERLNISQSDQRAYHPYTEDSKGPVLCAGAGSIVMESMESAERRGADILGTVMGFSMGTRLDRMEESYTATMRSALKDAGVTPKEVSIVIPQAAGIPSYDRAEEMAMDAVFQGATVPTPVFKRKTGNLMAAIGVTNTIFALQTLAFTREQKRRGNEAIAMINCFDFQGHNASLVIKLA